MLEGLVAAGFYVCFYGSGRRVLPVGAVIVVPAAVSFFLPGLSAAVPVLSALWLVLAGGLWQAGRREELFLAGGLWLLVRPLAELLSGGAPAQTAVAAALLAMLALCFLHREAPHPLWAAALLLLWAVMSFLDSIAYAQPRQRIMAIALYLGAGSVLACQQIFCALQELDRAEQKTGVFGEPAAGRGFGKRAGASGAAAGGAYERNSGAPGFSARGLQEENFAGGMARVWEVADREYRQLQIFEHDFRHHLDMVGALYEGGDPEGARAYMEDLKQARQSRQGRRNGGERELSCLMLAKREECRRAGIEFSYQIVGSPFGIAQMDMTALLLNLLDNAIRACRRAPKPRSIAVMLLARGELWQIELTNSGRYEPGKEPQDDREKEESLRDIREDGAKSLRNDREDGAKDSRDARENMPERPLHGLGMISVQQIVEKYHGSSRIYQEEDRVVQKLILTQRNPL
ncbi:MAG: GHKL domain-containing protein [Lachnospiraceae bacterium]|nr:GHKL domain-containing protein [Lachnospiraceae bacterium]